MEKLGNYEDSSIEILKKKGKPKLKELADKYNDVGPQLNNILTKNNIKSKNSKFVINIKTEEDKLPERSKSALDFVEENLLLKAQLISSQEEVNRLKNTIKDLQSKTDLPLKKYQPVLRSCTPTKQETIELESELQRLKDKLVDKKAMIRSLCAQVEKEQEEKEDIK